MQESVTDTGCGMQNATNSQPAMLINALDMTEQKTMEIELEQAKRELLRSELLRSIA